MTHSINITLSEAAQRAAILAGEPAKRCQSYDVPPELLPRLLALPWTALDYHGVATCVVPEEHYVTESVLNGDPGVPIELSHYRAYASRAVPFERRPSDAAEAIGAAEAALLATYDWIEERRAARMVEEDARDRKAQAEATEWAALPLAWRASVDGIGLCRPLDSDSTYRGPLRISGYSGYDRTNLARRVPEALAEAEREVDRLRAEAKRERQEQLRAIVVDHGSEEQLERFDAGVLPNEEYVALAEQHLFAPFDGLATYEPLAESDLDHREDCSSDPEDDVRFGSSEAERESWDADEWAGIKRVRTVVDQVPGATMQAREHRAHCRQCQSALHRYGVRVRVEYAGDTYDREFAI